MLSKQKFDFFPSIYQILLFSWNFFSTVTFINISFFLIIWSSAFIYLTFYYIYIPIFTHQRIINFQFDSDCLEDCNHPYAEVALSDYKTPFMFAKGQSYKFLVELDLPESNVNWDQGMFMLRLQLNDERGTIIMNTATSSILRYKSPLLRIVNLLFYWPFLIFNFKQEAQNLVITLHNNYIDGITQGAGPAVSARLIIEGKFCDALCSSNLTSN